MFNYDEEEKDIIKKKLTIIIYVYKIFGYICTVYYKMLQCLKKENSDKLKKEVNNVLDEF